MVSSVRIATGSMSPVPSFLTKTEEFLKGKKLTGEVIETAAAIASEEVSPRTSKDYRKRVTGRLVSRFLKEARS